MWTLLIMLVVGAGVTFVAPILMPARFRDAKLYNYGVRALGVVIMLFAVLSTSYVNVGDGKFAQMFRKYGGGALTGGKIVAIDGENGPQANVLRPGFHFQTLINVFYSVDSGKSETVILPGHVGILYAKDGEPLRPGQAFADPFPSKLGTKMLDAKTFLTNHGQRGPQLTVLPPGTYIVNDYLWKVTPAPAKDVETGFVGVVKSNVWADIDFGTLKADKPSECKTKTVKEEVAGRIEAPIVPVGCIGVWEKSLQPGKYYFNPDAFDIIPIDTRAQVWTYAGGYDRCEISLTVDSNGEITQKRNCHPIEKRPDDADRAVYVKMEGWDVPLELRVVAQVSPNEASCVVAGVGSLREVEDRVLTPSIRAIVRDVAGGTYEVEEAKADTTGKPVLDKEGKPVMQTVRRPTKVLDLISQRPLLEKEVEKRIVPEAGKSCVTIREVRLGEPAIPPELLVAVRREQLATQLSKAYIQERDAQTKRIDSEKAKATANQQATLVTAEIGVQASAKNAEAAKNLGQGERDRLTLISEGQKAQKDVLGSDATVSLQKYTIAMEKVFEFANKHPDTITAALQNASKFVPNTYVAGGNDGGGIMTGILGKFLSGTDTPSMPKPARQ